jgi:hypothetical protein
MQILFRDLLHLASKFILNQFFFLSSQESDFFDVSLNLVSLGLGGSLELGDIGRWLMEILRSLLRRLGLRKHLLVESSLLLYCVGDQVL